MTTVFFTSQGGENKAEEIRPGTLVSVLPVGNKEHWFRNTCAEVFLIPFGGEGDPEVLLGDKVITSRGWYGHFVVNGNPKDVAAMMRANLRYTKDIHLEPYTDGTASITNLRTGKTVVDFGKKSPVKRLGR